MTPGFQKTVTPLLCLALLELVAGCYSLDGIMRNAGRQYAPGPPIDPAGSHRTGKNHYKPAIIASNGNFIRVKYLSVGPNAEHVQVTQLISDHCDGAYIETNRAELRGYTTVDAECTHGTESLQ